MRTPLTYYGGKQKLAGEIAAMIPNRLTYVEPFAGGLAVLFARTPAAREVVNDLDGAICAFWRIVRDRPDDLARLVELTPYARDEWRECRADDPAVEDDLERARRLLVCVDQSFGRTRRSWSVPALGKGRGRWQPASFASLPDRIRDVAGRLHGVAVENRDALELVAACDQPDVAMYLDPPYAGEHRLAPSQGYVVEDLDWSEFVAGLVRVEHAALALSSYPNEHTDWLEAEGWERHDFAGVRRNVGSSGGSPLEPAPECLWRNPACVEGTSQLVFEDVAA